ncbi:heavy metal translocating P-type ATPase [Clostridium sp.]|uniref:heavy metal translocating P-type ATPase n=1 Tax=Clostridium sp. TaxID=1506 RepID=UPI003F31E6B1
MENSKKIKLILSGLTCANCGNKIEERVNKLEDVIEANLNFSTSLLLVEYKESIDKKIIVDKVKEIVKSLEPDVKVMEKSNNISNRNSVKLKQNNVCTDSKCTDTHESVIESEKVNKKTSNDNSLVSIIKENLRLIIGAIIYFIAIISPENVSISIVLFALAYVLIGGKVVLTACRNILRGEIFDENFLMTVATLGAFFIGELPEGVAVMLFYEVGEMFQSYAVNRSRKSITSLMDIRADYANILEGDVEKKVSPELVKIDDVILIKPGERVPLDGVVVEGSSFVDTSALTGEAVPREIKQNEEILAGYINNSGVIKVRVTKLFEESTVSRILELVENASSKKAPTEKFITKFSKVYTPIVVFSALALAVIPPLLLPSASFQDWIYRALIFLVVSCPCALVVSIPLGLFAGIGGASKRGILVKGGNYLEGLKDIDTVVFDKTGTLTKGIFKVVEINEINIDKNILLEISAIGESLSNHPIAQSIVSAYGKEIDKNKIKDYEEVSGHGIKAIINNSTVLLGNEKLMKKFNIAFKNEDTIGTIVHIAIDNEYKGNIIISDEIKENSKKAIKDLKEIGVLKTVMLTGDRKAVGEKVGDMLEIDNVYYELLPTDKVDKIENILSNKVGNGKVAFVGDGINDAPVLARADIGVAMGAIGSDAAIEAADVVLMNDDPESLVEAIKVARKTNKILWQNIIFSLGIKIFVLILGAMGIANMWGAVFADVGVTILAVLNSVRCLK